MDVWEACGVVDAVGEAVVEAVGEAVGEAVVEAAGEAVVVVVGDASVVRAAVSRFQVATDSVDVAPGAACAADPNTP